MRLREFEELVSDALESLPLSIQQMLENVTVVGQEWPTYEQLLAQGISDPYGLLGLYEGTPQIDRGTDYNMVLPDKITIFKSPLEAICESLETLAKEVRDTVVHELAHHFGISDEQLDDMGH